MLRIALQPWPRPPAMLVDLPRMAEPAHIAFSGPENRSRSPPPTAPPKPAPSHGKTAPKLRYMATPSLFITFYRRRCVIISYPPPRSGGGVNQAHTPAKIRLFFSRYQPLSQPVNPSPPPRSGGGVSR